MIEYIFQWFRNNNWVNSSHRIYNYDNFGNETYSSLESWKNESWSPEFKIENKFTPTGEMTYSRSEIWENGWQPYNSYYSLPLPEFDYDISFGYYEFNAVYADKNDIRFLVPDSYVLYQNYPNPFNASTEIYFSIPENGNVILNVYDILGRKVKELKTKR